MTLEEDRIMLHDLRGVNLKVDFFLGTRKEYIEDTKCISYSICWDTVNVRVDQITLSEELSELDFYHVTQQLIIDDHVLSGEVLCFRCDKIDGALTAYCKMLLGRDY
jgi:hypothetical protein